MAYGLPVIATPNCGEVVTDGRDGFIVSAQDSLALARTVQRYLDEPAMLLNQSRAAKEKSQRFSLNRLTEDLLNLEYTLKTITK